MLVGLRFPRYEHACNLSIHSRHHNPIAVEMTTLQQDAQYYGVAGSYQLIYDLGLHDVLFNELSGFLRTFEKVGEGVRRKSVG